MTTHLTDAERELALRAGRQANDDLDDADGWPELVEAVSLAVAEALAAHRAATGVPAEPTSDALGAIIDANPDKVIQAIQKPELKGWFVGQLMQRLNGKLDPIIAAYCVSYALASQHKNAAASPSPPAQDAGASPDARFAWLIEAPGGNYLSVYCVGHQHCFRWDKDHLRAIRFANEKQADDVMMAVRRLAPDLFGFAISLGEAKPVEHKWLDLALPEEPTP